MKQAYQFRTKMLFVVATILTTLLACNNPKTDTTKETTVDSVAANIKMYTHV